MRLPANEIHIWSWDNRSEPDARLEVLGAYVGRRLHHSDIERETLGKPFIAERNLRPALHFSISHRDGISAMAIAATAVGLDLERIAPLADLDALARYCMTTSEARELSRVADSDRLVYFYRCWTHKEAYLKAIGSGLRVEPRTVDTVRGVIDHAENCWYLHAVRALPGFAMSLATEMTDAVIVPVRMPRVHAAVDQH